MKKEEKKIEDIKKLKFKNRDLSNMLEALKILDGIAENGVIVYFDLDERVKYACIKNKRKLRPLIQDINDARDSALKALLNPGEEGIEPGDPRMGILMSITNAIFEKEEELDFEFHKFDITGLNLSKNGKIPSSVIEALEPMLLAEL